MARVSAQGANPTPAGQTATIQVQSQLVLVPTAVQAHNGEILYGLKAKQFAVEADGVPQVVKLDENDEARPISLVIAVQCSRSAIAEFDKLRGLPTMAGALLGGAPARVAVMDFGAEPEVITGFSGDPARRDQALAAIEPCPEDGKAAIYDAVAAAAKLFESARTPGRRVILLISETRDHGSKTRPDEVIRALGRDNIVVDSVSFSPGRDEIVDDAKHADGATGGVVGLLLMALQALRRNVSKEFARQSGGEYINFATANAFDQGMNGLANRVNNYYLLSFQPKFPERQAETSPLHSITVRIPEYPKAVIRHRESYWAEPVGTATEPGRP